MIATPLSRVLVLILLVIGAALYMYDSRRSARSGQGALAEHDITVDTSEYAVLVPAGFRYKIMLDPDGSVHLSAELGDSKTRFSVLRDPVMAPEDYIELIKDAILRSYPSWRFSSITTHVDGLFKVSEMTGTDDYATVMVAVLTAPGKLYCVHFYTNEKNFDYYSNLFNNIIQSLRIHA